MCLLSFAYDIIYEPVGSAYLGCQELSFYFTYIYLLDKEDSIFFLHNKDIFPLYVGYTLTLTITFWSIIQNAQTFLNDLKWCLGHA